MQNFIAMSIEKSTNASVSSVELFTDLPTGGISCQNQFISSKLDPSGLSYNLCFDKSERLAQQTTTVYWRAKRNQNSYLDKSAISYHSFQTFFHRHHCALVTSNTTRFLRWNSFKILQALLHEHRPKIDWLQR